MNAYAAIISIGSNLGDPQSNCCRGMSAIDADDQMSLDQRSRFYWTEPVDYTDQQWFLNAALKVTTSLPPLALLAKLQAIQRAMGRKTGGVRFGPRVLDLDIIFYADWVVDTPPLQIPHPRMHKRRFVLQPICDIDPEFRHPVLGQTVFHLLNQLDKEDQKIKPCYLNC